MKSKYFFHCLLSGILFLLSMHLSAQYENNDAVYLKLNKVYTLNSDGSMDYRVQKKLKLQTYRAFNSLYGETFITYNPQEQKLKINEAYTIMADGKKVPEPENALNEVLPGFCTSAPAYNHLREMVITHTGLERNAVINLDYSIHSNKGYYPALMGNEVLSETEPVQELSIVIKVPSKPIFNVRYSMFGYRVSSIEHRASDNSKVQPVITTEGPFKVYTWNLKDIPAISAEEFQVSGYEFYPRLIFSTSDDRENLYNEFLAQPAFRYEVSDDMASELSFIVANNKETLDIILKLQEKVVNEHRLWPVPLRYAGFKCRTATETWNSNGGTLAEKAVLLIALLKAANIPAEPALVIPTTFYDEKIGTLLDIEDILVRTDLKESGSLYLSVNSLNPQNMKYALPGKTIVMPDPGRRPEVINADEYTNKLLLKAEFSLDEKNQLEGALAATFDNNFNPWLTLLRDKNKVKSFISGGIAYNDLKEMKTANIAQDESFVIFTVNKENPFHKDTNFYTWALPYFNNGIESWDIQLLPKERTTSLEIPSEAEEKYEITLHVPAGLKLFSPDKKTEISNKAGSFLFEIKKDNNKILVTKSIKLTKGLIKPEDYPSFKALMDHWNSDRYREIIFTQ
jgi:hypothetical protein